MSSSVQMEGLVLETDRHFTHCSKKATYTGTDTGNLVDVMVEQQKAGSKQGSVRQVPQRERKIKELRYMQKNSYINRTWTPSYIKRGKGHE